MNISSRIKTALAQKPSHKKEPENISKPMSAVRFWELALKEDGWEFEENAAYNNRLDLCIWTGRNGPQALDGHGPCISFFHRWKIKRWIEEAKVREFGKLLAKNNAESERDSDINSNPNPH